MCYHTEKLFVVFLFQVITTDMSISEQTNKSLPLDHLLISMIPVINFTVKVKSHNLFLVKGREMQK